ncbi:MAG: DUF5715 family protein [Longimicrobiales bacterium]
MLRRLTAPALFVVLATSTVQAQSLDGSPWSLTVQNRAARTHDFTYLRNRSQVDEFVAKDLLVPIADNADFRLHNVSYPYARPEVATFLHRLAEQYHAMCGERMVVTSLVRPESMRLWNSSDRSVHPTGMAIDLRKSNMRRCRSWLESTLLELEGQGVLEATEEFHPPHYHIALFPKPYFKYLAMLGEKPDRATLASASRSKPEPRMASAPEPSRAGFIPHEVLSGETLWGLARRFGTTVTELLAVNELSGPEIKAGQRLRIPVRGGAAGGVMVADATRTPAPEPARVYTVDRGDSLWSIARRHRTTVDQLKQENNLASSRILPGQTLRIPVDQGR